MATIVVDFKAVRVEVTPQELEALESAEIPNTVNEKLLASLKANVESGEGIMEQWEGV